MKSFFSLMGIAALAALVTAAAAASSGDGLTITNTGSTNSVGYTIKVWGSGRVVVTRANATRTASVGAPVAAKILADARAARASVKSSTPRTSSLTTACMKSASFGSRTYVDYHGWRSPDLSCPTTGALALLWADVRVITATVGAGGIGRPITLPTNEPRRIPNDTPAATPHP